MGACWWGIVCNSLRGGGVLAGNASRLEIDSEAFKAVVPMPNDLFPWDRVAVFDHKKLFVVPQHHQLIREGQVPLHQVFRRAVGSRGART